MEPSSIMPATMRVMSTLALVSAMRELVTEFQQRAGMMVATDFAPTNALLQRIRLGETGDIAILTSQAIDQLIDEGLLVSGSRRDIALSSVGIAVKAGAPKPEIGSVSAFRSALLNAESIAYSKIGASGVFFADLIQQLGIAEEINAKARIIPSGFTAELVASGEVELAVQQVSELLTVPGIEIAGRLPQEIQSITTFSAGLFVSSSHPDAAINFTTILSSSESSAIIQRSGLDPL